MVMWVIGGKHEYFPKYQLFHVDSPTKGSHLFLTKRYTLVKQLRGKGEIVAFTRNHKYAKTLALIQPLPEIAKYVCNEFNRDVG